MYSPKGTYCVAPVVKILIFLDLAKNLSFLDGHYLIKTLREFMEPGPLA